MKIREFFRNAKDEVFGFFRDYKNARKNALTIEQVKFALKCIDLSIEHVQAHVDYFPNDKTFVMALKAYKRCREKVQEALEGEVQ